MKKYIIILLFLISISMKSWGQSPGGVTGFAAWYKGDVGLTATGWVDQSSNGYNLTRGASIANSNMMNFNPVATFNNTNTNTYSSVATAKSNWPTGTTANTYYYVAKNSIGITDFNVMGIGASGLNNGFHSGQIGVVGRIASDGTTPIVTGSSAAMVTSPPNWDAAGSNSGINIVRTGYNGGGATGRNYIAAQGGAETTNSSNTAPTYTNTSTFRIGASGANTALWRGDVAEVITFPTKHNAVNANKIESYLGIKYGITLGTTASPVNYTSSAGSVIWTSNATYQNNIAGIGRDDASGLHQRQSQSQNAGVQPIIGNNSTILSANISGAGNFGSTDNFMIWGSDIGTDKLETSFAFGTVNTRMNRIWRVQETGTVGTVKVAIKKTDLAGTMPHLIVSTDATFDGTDTRLAMTEETIGGVIYYTTTVDLLNSQFFTFGSFVVSPGGVLTGLRAWYKANAHTSQPSGSIWPDQSGNGKDLTSGGSLPTWNSGSSLYNFNPYFNFTAASGNYFYTTGSVMGTNASPGSIFNVAKSNSTSGYRVVSGFGNDNPQINQDGILGYDLWRQNANRVNDFGTDASAIPTHSINMFWNQSGGSQLQYNGFNSAINNTADGNITDNLFAIGSEGFNVPGVGSVLYLGGIPEVIVYNQNLNATDQSKINSYLSIKYGITLRTGNLTTGTFNYLSSTGATIWNGTTNSIYHNNIAGIGRDNTSGLYQKQSKSINANQKLVFGAGTGLFSTNAANTNTLSDGQFLIVGDNGLTQKLSTTLIKTDAPGGAVNSCFAAIWKVQNTDTLGIVTVAWPAGITNLHLVRSTDATFNTSDEFIPMSGTTTINGVAYNTAQITFNNGDFFTFAGFGIGPGGVVGGLKFWHRADNGLNTSGTTVTSWNDVSTNGLNIGQMGTALRPDLGTPSMLSNFHPFVNFTANQVLGQRTMSSLSTNQFEVYTTLNPGATGGLYFGLGRDNTTNSGTNWDSPHQWSGGDFTHYNQTGSTSATSNPAPINSAMTPPIINHSRYDVGVHSKSINGSVMGSTSPLGTTNNTAWVRGGHYVGGNNVANSLMGGDDPAFRGQLYEIFLYERILTNVERQRVNSYLAIRNGITLRSALPSGGSQTGTYDYLSSKDTIIWNGTTNSAYHNNIAGIGRDSASVLSQKQSNSANTGNQVIIATTGVANTNQLNSLALNEGQFLIWGDNNLSKSLSTPLSKNLPSGNVTHCFAAIWKVQNTGNVGTVRVMWPAQITNLHLIQSSDANFDASDVFTSMSNTQTINGVAYAYADVTLSNGSFFTFGGFATGPGGVLNPTVWVKAEMGTNTTVNSASVNSWINNGIGGGVFTTLGTTTNPIYTNNKINFNPTVGYNSLCAGCGLKNVGVNAAGGGLVNPVTSYAVSIRDGWPSGFMTTIAFPNIYNGTNENYASLGSVNSTQWQLYAYGPSANSVTFPTQLVNTPYITSLNFPAVGQAVYSTNNGILKTSGSNVTSGYYVGKDANLFADGRSVGSGAGYNGSYGHMSEVISYTKTLTAVERSQVESYLAIKSGVTLLNTAGTATTNYIASDGTTKVWDAAINSLYNFNIAGIARDDVSTLDQRVSTTSNTTVTMGKLIVSTINNFSLSNQDASRVKFDSNFQYVIIGDNNSISTTLTDVNPVNCPALSDGLKQIAKKWFVQETGSVNSIFLEIDLNAYGISSDIQLLVGDNEPITLNSYIVSALSVSSSKAVFKVDFKDNSRQYFTVVGKVGAPACATCRGGKYIIRQGNSWNTAAKILNDSTGWFSYATDGEGTNLQARSIVTYTTPSNEWVDAWYPAPYGASALMPHAGTTNGAASKRVYTTVLNRAGKVNFELAGISEWYGNKVKVVVKGYCGAGQVTPIITEKITGWNKIYNGYTISGNTVTGNKYYRGLDDYSAVKVNFNKVVERIEIEYTVERSPVSYTHFWFTVGDMSVECESPIEPNKDNVYIKQSFEKDTMPSCNTAIMKLNIKNQNCNGRTINITNTLPTGLEYVANSYESDSTSIMPTYSGTNFSLSNFKIPSGETNLFIKVKPTDTVISITTFNTQSNYNVTIATGGTGNTILSDDMSALSGLQSTKITFTPATKPAMPKMKFYSGANNQSACDTLQYTIEIDNTNIGTTMSGLVLQPFLNLGQIINGSVALSSGLSGAVEPNPVNGSTSFFIPQLNINSVGVHTVKFSTVVTKIDEFAINTVELFFNPAVNECAISAKVSAILDKKCPTCENGKGFFNMKKAWADGGASARTSNSISNIIVGNPESGTIKAFATVQYPNSTTEWLPTTFPRQNGSYTEISRYDNLNGNAGMVKYTVDFKDTGNFPISARPSFEIAGATKYYYQTDQIKVYGICGDDTFVPKLNYAYNSTTANNNYYRRFTINKAQGTMTGTQPYYDNTDWAKAFVEFESEVHKIVIEWKVDRAPVNTTLGSLYIGDISLICRNKPDPIPDNVFIIASFLNDTLLTCKDATIKLNVKNWNCDTSTISITNNLTGLVYVDSSYVGLGSEIPTYSGSSFTLNNLKVPSGNSYIYVKVRPSNVSSTATYSTFYNYTVSGGINVPNPYQSDDNSGQLGYQNTSIKYSASAIITPKPKVTLTADKICYEVEGDTIQYTVAFENNTGSTIPNVEFSNPIEAGQNYIDTFSSTILGGTVVLQDSIQLEVHNMTLPVGTSFLKYRTIVNKRDSVKFILNSDRIVIDPTSECAEANTVNSNLFRADTAFYYPGLTTGTPKNTNVGITTMSKHQQAGWPWNVPNGWIALHSKSKGFVITRTTPGAITAPVEGMIIYDTIAKCIKLYNGTTWTCIQRQCKP